VSGQLSSNRKSEKEFVMPTSLLHSILVLWIFCCQRDNESFIVQQRVTAVPVAKGRVATFHRNGDGSDEGNFFIIKPTRYNNFTNLFWHETLHVLGSSSVCHHEFIHYTLGNGICHTGFWATFEQEHMLLLESCLQTCMTYTITECIVNKLLMTDRGTARNM